MIDSTADIQALFDRLKEIASTRVWSDDAMADAPESCMNDNVDDAYSEGYEVGEVRLARSLLEQLGLSYTVKE